MDILRECRIGELCVLSLNDGSNAVSFLPGFKHLIIMLEREGDFYKKLAPSASTSAAALGVLSVATAVMRIAKNHVKEDQLVTLINAQIG